MARPAPVEGLRLKHVGLPDIPRTPGQIVPELIQLPAEPTGAGIGIIPTERAYLIRSEIIAMTDSAAIQERFQRLHKSWQLMTEALCLLQGNQFTDTLPEMWGILGGQIRR